MGKNKDKKKESKGKKKEKKSKIENRSDMKGKSEGLVAQALGQPPKK
jgi:hypothetical protein